MGIFEIRNAVNNWLSEGKAIAIATVIQTWGSSPRRAGAKLAVSADMDISGSVSGGCVEAEVITMALETLDDQCTRLLHFEVSDNAAWEVGLACGGSLSVVVEPLDVDWWQQLIQHQRERLLTVTIAPEKEAPLRNPARQLSNRQQQVIYNRGQFSVPLASVISHQQHSALEEGVPYLMQGENATLFFDVHLPPPRLIIIGGAHVSVALQHIAAAMGYRTVIVDPRKTFATTDRFPAVEAIHHAYPNRILPALSLDTDTCLVVLSHDPKIDDPALLHAFSTEVGYIGVMSSKRTHEQRLQRLREQGATDADIARLHVPVGINIGARTPEEIALSIMAEIVALRNGVQRPGNR